MYYVFVFSDFVSAYVFVFVKLCFCCIFMLQSGRGQRRTAGRLCKTRGAGG